MTRAGLGLAAATWFAWQLPARPPLIAAAAVAAGVLVTAAAALLPAALLRLLPMPTREQRNNRGMLFELDPPQSTGRWPVRGSGHLRRARGNYRRRV